MATTITPENLTVTISEVITLNGQTINSENQLVIQSVNEFDKRIMTIPTASEVTVISFGSAVAAGTFIRGDMKYLRVTNLDAVNYARIRVKKSGADTFDTKLDAGKSFMIGNTKESVSAAGAAFATFVDADSINMQADTANVDIEYVVASI
jgi:hypothetical protein